MNGIIKTVEEFHKKVISNHDITNTTFDFPHATLSNLTHNLTFENCIFKTKFLHLYDIKDESISITFRNCSFEGRLEVSGCMLSSLHLEDIYLLERLYIHGNKELIIRNFSFKNNFGKNENPLDAKIEIQNYIFESFEFFNVNHTGSSFRFFQNLIGNENYRGSYIQQKFENSWICNAQFSNNIFNEKVSFFRTIFIQKKELSDTNHFQGTSFFRNSFKDVEFENTSFSKDCKFTQCTFHGRVNLYNMNNYFIGDLSVRECTFNYHVDFEGTQIKHLALEFCVFDKTVSFASTKTERIFLNRNLFNKAAYFDDLIIDDIISCNRKTLRTIKQELQKKDNKIDYNRFRAYELQAYYQELNWKWKGGFKDKTILWATKHVTGFDHSWRKALRFVLSSAIVFFSLFFLAENYDLTFSWSGIPQYATGYFRFLLITDFYNPLESGREYIPNNGWNHIASWFIFILGKIVIAFGIYEMIQAFRKFKA